MANETGIYKLKDGGWGFRYTISVCGKRKDVKRVRDAYGNPMKTKRDAVLARAEAMKAEEIPQQIRIVRKSVKEVYQEFCENGRKDRAYRTKQKQDSLWNNHLCQKFGKRYVDEINSSEVNDYLVALYCEQGYSYQYTESFLKMFYLIFGQAYSRNYLPVDLYNRLCVNKDTKIKMPKMKTEDDTAIVAFSRKELALLDEYFKGTNAETAYLLGRYCGLRINETFGLKWSNVDLTSGTITIDRQMQYQDGLIKLVSPKTRNSKRTIYLCPTLKTHLEAKAQRRNEDQKLFANIVHHHFERQAFVSLLVSAILNGLFHHAESGLTFDHSNQCRILVRSGIACLFQRGLGSNDSAVGEIISEQIFHDKTFLMLLASCVFFRSPPLF